MYANTYLGACEAVECVKDVPPEKKLFLTRIVEDLKGRN